MNKEEIEDILEELHLVRPETLKPKAKKLFETIMSIADERDELQQENQKYKEVIDKAIKFIDNYMYENYCYVGSEDRLKDILKEVSDEKNN